ncbi:MAG: hypothetical protein H3C47_10215 [Candidatus Cloacimonetes bacterium]|nr:hypothetical protein [Candidatus Cloacimonadota bacterium]
MSDRIVLHEFLRYRGLMFYWILVFFPIVFVGEKKQTLFMESIIAFSATVIIANIYLSSRQCFTRLLPLSHLEYLWLRRGSLFIVLMAFYVFQQLFLSHYPYDLFTGLIWFMAWSSAVPILVKTHTATQSWFLSLSISFVPALIFLIVR